MRFALVDNEKTVPAPELKGRCPICGAEMIAKCGSERVHHWAHRGQRVCDDWWEPETEWHRTWKLNFPPHWQEVVLRDQAGEKHIADVRTELGFIIEIQHSHLRLEERASREQFYGNLAWVVDGRRLTGDLPRFLEGKRSFIPILRKGMYLTLHPEEAFSRKWLNCTVPVYFDFSSAIGSTEQVARAIQSLWCLLPKRVFGYAVVLKIARADFIRLAHERTQPIPTQAILMELAKWLTLKAERHARTAARSRAIEVATYTPRPHRVWRATRRLRRF